MKTIFWSKYNINPNGIQPPADPVFAETTEPEPEPEPIRPWESAQYAWEKNILNDENYFTVNTDTETDSDTGLDEDEKYSLAKGSLLAEQPGGEIRAQALLQRACDDGYETCPHCNQVIIICFSDSCY